MTDEHADEAVDLSAADLALLIEAAKTTRLVSVSVGAKTYRVGWVRADPGESILQGVVVLLRGVADLLEEMNAES